MSGTPEGDDAASIGSAAVSRQNTKSTRNSSPRRASSRNAIDRIYSVRYLDDNSLYHGRFHDDHCADDSDYDEEDSEDVKRSDMEGLGEVRDGMKDEKDLEAPPLSKKSTTRSKKDPNIVTRHR